MKIAIMGGTFNPIHFGHLFLAEEVRQIFGYNKIIFVPNNIPALKNIETPVSPEQRLKMLQIALKSFSEFIVDECEIKRGGVSYMVDTLKEINDKYNPKEKLGLIIGDDLVNQLPSWKCAKTIFKYALIIIAHRKYNYRLKANFPHFYIDNKILPISSSEIRERIFLKKSIRFLLPESVYEYIKQEKLYS